VTRTRMYKNKQQGSEAFMGKKNSNPTVHQITDPRVLQTLKKIDWIIDNNDLSSGDLSMLKEIVAQLLEHDAVFKADVEQSKVNMNSAFAKTFSHLELGDDQENTANRRNKM